MRNINQQLGLARSDLRPEHCFEIIDCVLQFDWWRGEGPVLHQAVESRLSEHSGGEGGSVPALSGKVKSGKENQGGLF